jgi:hypothetical protein
LGYLGRRKKGAKSSWKVNKYYKNIDTVRANGGIVLAGGYRQVAELFGINRGKRK